MKIYKVREGSLKKYKVHYVDEKLVAMRPCLAPGHNHKFKSFGPQNRTCPEGRKYLIRSIDTAMAERSVMWRAPR